MEQYIFWITTTAIGLILALIRYNLNKTIDTLDKVKEASEIHKESMIKVTGRLDLIENNHNHLADKFDQLYDAIKDLTVEMKHLTKELSKKKDI